MDTSAPPLAMDGWFHQGRKDVNEKHGDGKIGLGRTELSMKVPSRRQRSGKFRRFFRMRDAIPDDVTLWEMVNSIPKNSDPKIPERMAGPW
jgi:hypothetical protein